MLFPTSDFRNPICLEMKLLSRGIDTTGGVMDLGSVDSSDTYASCNTAPFPSQADLTEDSNLYVNPLELRNVKKSASGDTMLRGSPVTEEPTWSGSRGSLNDTPLPKHRKTRFQQSSGGRLRESEESLETVMKRRRPSFMPARPLATATRLINQHLFGLQALGGKGKNGESRSSLSVDSIDSRICPTPETHRRSKSILKKVDSAPNPRRDPEMEKLISDNVSAAGSDYSPGKSPVSGSGTKTRNSLKFAVPGDLGPPLYICPPPPPMETSPTEETRLLGSVRISSS